MQQQWADELEHKLKQPLLLTDISSFLHKLKNEHITQQAVRTLLYQIKNSITDKLITDRVLEMLDIVEGYCQSRYKVW